MEYHTHMDNQIIETIDKDPNYRLLKKVPEQKPIPHAEDLPPFFIAAIIDLETMGLDPLTDEIIEIGILWFSFSQTDGIIGIYDTYNELNEPSSPIPEAITKITGITNECVKGKVINWEKINALLNQTHLVICHNSQFDRNFLENQTPNTTQEIIKRMPFACTINDIDWSSRGFESSKLDYLNFKMGYFYDGHRALNDCYATYNLFTVEPDSFEELKQNVRKKETLVVAEHAPFDKKDLLKQKKYRWSDGQGELPKAWWSTLPNEDLEDELQWLEAKVYGREGATKSIPKIEITARKRYSLRAQKVSNE